MKKYGARSIVVVASQFVPEEGKVPEGIETYIKNDGTILGFYENTQGRTLVKSGDYLVKGMGNNPSYIVKKNIFNIIYEEFCEEHHGHCNTRPFNGD